jgi:hypothetical protein
LWIGVLALAVVCRAQNQTPDVKPADAAVEAKPADALAESVPTPPPPPPSFLKRLFSVQAVTATVPGAILQQVHDWPDEWGKTRLGFEKRVGSLYAQFVVGVLIEEGVKAVHHEDTR